MNREDSKCVATKSTAFKRVISTCSVIAWVMLASALCEAQLTTTGTIDGTVPTSPALQYPVPQSPLHKLTPILSLKPWRIHR